VIGTWGPWTRLGNLPWAELPASALGRFETLQQLLGEAEGVREGVRERMLGQEGDGHGEWRRRRRGGRGGGEAGASSEQLSHFVEDGLHGLLIESPELDLGNRVASKVSHKLLFFFAGSKSLALWGFPNPDVCGQWAVGSGSGRASAWERIRVRRQRGIGDEEDSRRKRKDIWASNAVVGRMAGQFFTLHASRFTYPRFHASRSPRRARKQIGDHQVHSSPRQPTRSALIAVAGRKALHLCLMFCTVDLI
jgi:hypothetical protein